MEAVERWDGYGAATGWRQAARVPKRTVLRIDECIGLLATIQQSAILNIGLQNAPGEFNVVQAVFFGIFYSQKGGFHGKG